MKKLFLLAVVFLFHSVAHATTVVGLHGFLANARSMRTIERALENCCLNVCLWDYPAKRRCIQDNAYCLVELLKQIAAQEPEQPIDFVCHSIGALVLRNALNLPDCPEEAKMGRAVLLTPPNQGSKLARRFSNFQPAGVVMGDKSGWQLMNYTPEEVAALGEFPETMEVLVIAGTKGSYTFFCEPNDGYLAVEETYLNTPHTFYCYPVSHAQVLTSPQVLCCMCHFLTEPRPQLEEEEKEEEDRNSDES